jgi:hypothetical protein
MGVEIFAPPSLCSLPANPPPTAGREGAHPLQPVVIADSLHRLVGTNGVGRAPITGGRFIGVLGGQPSRSLILIMGLFSRPP